MEIGLFLYRQINEQLNYTDRHFDVFSFATFKSSEIMTINTKKVISIRGLMPWPKKTGAGLPDKGSAINGWLSLGVWLGSMICGLGLWTSASCDVRSLGVVRMAVKLRYCNIP